MREFTPDYNNILKAARNMESERTPLYEHSISEKVMERIMNKNFRDLYNGNRFQPGSSIVVDVDEGTIIFT